MSINKICIKCGGTSFVSDRSLGGRMVCFKCGSSSFRTKSFSSIKNKKYIFLAIGLLVLLIIVI